MKRKTVWIMFLACLCVVLYTIVASRIKNTTTVIFGGVDGTYVTANDYLLNGPVETPEPTVDIWPKIDIDLHQYTMVNDDNLLSAVYEPDVEMIDRAYTNGARMMFDASVLPELERMLADCTAAGHTVVVNAGYRAYSYQNTLFNGKASQIAMGIGVDDYNDPRYQIAVEEARTIVMFPGSSEHQLGLAVDLADKAYSKIYYDNIDHGLMEWLDEHCWEYGFIKRYPTRKLLLTGWDEPWHYRYVGVDAAKFIMEQGICYEEFYAHYRDDFIY